MPQSKIRFCLACGLLVAVACATGPSSQSKQGASGWLNLEGTRTNPLFPKANPQALVFLMVDCPMANMYAPELVRIEETYRKKGVAFTFVYVDSDITAERARQHVKAYGLKGMFVLDPKHSLAEKVGASVSPEVVVLGKDAKVVYRGRIDDRVETYGKVRPEPKRHDFRLALDEVLQGKKPKPSDTRAIGCIFRVATGPR